MTYQDEVFADTPVVYLPLVDNTDDYSGDGNDPVAVHNFSFDATSLHDGRTGSAHLTTLPHWLSLDTTPWEFTGEISVECCFRIDSPTYVDRGVWDSMTVYHILDKVDYLGTDYVYGSTTDSVAEQTLGEAYLDLTPLSYWAFDETSGTSLSDSSGNGHTLTASIASGAAGTVGAATLMPNGVGAALDLFAPSGTTSGFASMASASWMNVSDLSVFVLVSGASTFSTHTNTIICRDNTTGLNRAWNLFIDTTGNLKLFVKDSGGTSTTFTLKTGMAAGNNYYIGFVWDSAAGQLRSYVNGVQTITSITGRPGLASVTARLVVGDYDHTGGITTNQKWDGRIEEIFMQGSAVSSAQAAHLYDSYALTYVPPTPASGAWYVGGIPASYVDLWGDGSFLLGEFFTPSTPGSFDGYGLRSGAPINADFDEAIEHHLVFTESPTQISIYLDGALAATSGFAQNRSLQSLFYFGSGGDNSLGFTGWISDAAIYMTALSGARVLAHYEAVAGEDYVGPGSGPDEDFPPPPNPTPPGLAQASDLRKRAAFLPT